MTNDELAAFYRRYNTCCNEHRFEDLGEFVARDVAIDSTDRALDEYAAEVRAVVRAFPDYRWELRRLVVDAPWIAVQLTDMGMHRETFLGVQATGRSVAVPEFAFYRVDAGGLPRCGARPSTCICSNSCGSRPLLWTAMKEGLPGGTLRVFTEERARGGPCSCCTLDWI